MGNGIKKSCGVNRDRSEAMGSWPKSNTITSGRPTHSEEKAREEIDCCGRLLGRESLGSVRNLNAFVVRANG